MPRSHIVISGTGRSGTTFLVELMAHLGLDTGFEPQQIARLKDPVARAGLERDIRDADCPFVVKNPWFCDYAEEVFARRDIRVQHLFIPMRDLAAAAESRRLVQRQQLARLSPWKRLRTLIKRRPLDGGLVHTVSRRPGEQEALLQGQFYRLVQAAVQADVPATFLSFPRLVRDPVYLFEKLRPALGELRYADFHAVFARVAQPQLVNRLSARDI